MESNFDREKVNPTEMLNALTAIIVTPVIVPVAEVVKQPIVQTAIKEGMAVSQKYQDVMTEALENVDALVNGNSANSNQFSNRNSQISQNYLTDGQSAVAKDLLNVMSDFNADIYKMTNGEADLRIILPFGLGFFAITQLIKQGFKFDDIPWYILAWFAFDSFIKLNQEEESTMLKNIKS